MHTDTRYQSLPFLYFFFLMIRPPPRSTLFPTRRSSDLPAPGLAAGSTGRRSVCGEGQPRCRRAPGERGQDRKSTRLNSSHVKISYAVFCLKKKKIKNEDIIRNEV